MCASLTLNILKKIFMIKACGRKLGVILTYRYEKYNSLWNLCDYITIFADLPWRELETTCMLYQEEELYIRSSDCDISLYDCQVLGLAL